jgi:hypothetical protein
LLTVNSPRTEIRCSLRFKRCEVRSTISWNEKKRLVGAAYKEARGGNVSGKAIKDVEVEARARTLVEEKSKNLEEG